jgi:hypothetical protein
MLSWRGLGLFNRFFSSRLPPCLCLYFYFTFNLKQLLLSNLDSRVSTYKFSNLVNWPTILNLIWIHVIFYNFIICKTSHILYRFICIF